MQHALKTQKRAMRKAIASTLAGLSPRAVEEQSQAIASRVLALPAFRAAQTVSCYLSMPSGEVATPLLVKAILDQDKALYVPKIYNKDGIMDFLRVYSNEDLASLPSGTWGIKEPSETWEDGRRSAALAPEPNATNDTQLDVILLPGVAFDRSLSRLGHGKGYYDRFISSYITQGKTKPLLVGLCLREQLVDPPNIPMTELDHKVDLIVTPDTIIDAQTSSSSE